METATIQDFRKGTVLVDKSEGWEFTIKDKYDDGIWNARGDRGEKVIFECESNCYFVKK